jgi:glutamate synthase (NADPH) large chain
MLNLIILLIKNPFSNITTKMKAKAQIQYIMFNEISIFVEKISRMRVES